MKLPLIAATLMALPAAAFAGDLKIENAMVPLAPPGVMAHAAYMTLTNEGDTPMQLVGASAEGYMMTHIHMSMETDGIATMSAVDLIEIDPGESVVMEQGGLHIMLMRPEGPTEVGDEIAMTLEFADGSMEDVVATVMEMKGGMHKHGG